MNLEDARAAYQELSGKASDVARQLGFAGIAVIWVFTEQVSGGNRTVPLDLRLPAVLLVMGLGLDLVQYAAASLLWGGFARLKERAGTKEGASFDAPPRINWPALACFWVKLAATVGAYVLILRYLAGKTFG